MLRQPEEPRYMGGESGWNLLPSRRVSGACCSALSRSVNPLASNTPGQSYLRCRPGGVHDQFGQCLRAVSIGVLAQPIPHLRKIEVLRRPVESALSLDGELQVQF